MKLDVTDLRYVTSEEFRVLTAVRARVFSLFGGYGKWMSASLLQVEIGSKNHEVVPSTLIAQISGLRNGGVNKILGVLAKRNLVAKVQNTKCM